LLHIQQWCQLLANNFGQIDQKFWLLAKKIGRTTETILQRLLLQISRKKLKASANNQGFIVKKSFQRRSVTFQHIL
jgi:hypothetical protein